jgi:hypothetical protein
MDGCTVQIQSDELSPVSSFVFAARRYNLTRRSQPLDPYACSLTAANKAGQARGTPTRSLGRIARLQMMVFSMGA